MGARCQPPHTRVRAPPRTSHWRGGAPVSKLDDLEARIEAENPILRHYGAKVRRARAKAHHEGPKSPSGKQIAYLRFLLGNYPSTKSLEAFVRFANGYHHGPLTRVHWIQAISLVKDGHNWYGNAQHLVSVSYIV